MIRYPSGAVNSVAFSRDGTMLAAGGSDGTVLLWNRSLTAARSCPSPARGPVRSVAFSPDGDTLAASSDEGVVLVGRGQHGRELGRR